MLFSCGAALCRDIFVHLLSRHERFSELKECNICEVSWRSIVHSDVHDHRHLLFDGICSAIHLTQQSLDCQYKCVGISR